jgi:uncharacterized protein involved in exopolysaccharide biosynthesis
MTELVTNKAAVGDDVSLSEVVAEIWKRKLIIFAVSLIFAIAAVFYALQLPDQYRSETLLAPVQASSGGASGLLSGQMGGLASLAGINIGGPEKKSVLALQILNSRAFFEHICAKYDLLVPLIAAKSWDKERKELLLDAEIYDVKSEKWVRVVAPPLQQVPSMEEAYGVFKMLMSVSQDKPTSMVRVSLTHLSPAIAQQWVSILVAELNMVMRKREIDEAEQSIKYLNEQLSKTDVQEIKSVMYDLIEEQTKTLMLANVRKEFVFQVVDPAPYPEMKSGPKRAFIVLFAGLFGFFSVSIFFVFRLVMRKE